MARILEFCDGAERGDSSWWTSTNNNPISLDTTQVIHGTYCYRMNGPDGNNVATKLFTAASEVYFRVYLKTYSNGSVIRFMDGASVLASLVYNSTLLRWDISGATTGNTGNVSVPTGTWQCLEVHYKISDTVGEFAVRIDGVQVFTFSGDTKPGVSSTTNIIQFLLGLFYIDDLALDTSDWCGLGYYLPLNVNSNGTTNQWTSSSGNPNYQNVDEIPASDSDYNSSSVSGQVDEYGLTTTSLTNFTVQRVIPFVRSRNVLGGNLKAGLLTHSTPYTNVIPLSISFKTDVTGEYILNPNTGVAWTQGEIDDLQFYLEVV